MMDLHYVLTAASRLFITVVSIGSAIAMLWLNILGVVPRLPLGEFIFCIILGILTYPRLTTVYNGEQNAQETKQGTPSSAPSNTTEG